ncbi:MAG: hypothetical protein U0946_02210 [Patescibacteria group bacterium]|nr:hypothetical protein [Patescibacteria group bacterium]
MKNQGPTLKGMPGCQPSRARRQAKGRTLTSFLACEPNRNAFSQGRTLTGGLANGQAGATKLKGPTLTVFFPSPKLRLGLSNQSKTSIYSFWQSQSQTANSSPFL